MERKIQILFWSVRIVKLKNRGKKCEFAHIVLWQILNTNLIAQFVGKIDTLRDIIYGLKAKKNFNTELAIVVKKKTLRSIAVNVSIINQN